MGGRLGKFESKPETFSRRSSWAAICWKSTCNHKDTKTLRNPSGLCVFVVTNNVEQTNQSATTTHRCRPTCCGYSRSRGHEGKRPHRGCAFRGDTWSQSMLPWASFAESPAPDSDRRARFPQ